VIRHKIILFKHRHFFHIYRVIDRDVTEFRRAPPIRGRRTPSYLNIPYFLDIQYNDPDLIPIDAHYSKEGLTFCGYASTPSLNTQSPIHPSTLENRFLCLSSPIRNICGTVRFPTDNGVQLINECKINGNKLFGASDASFRDGRATHAWILSTGKVSDLTSDTLSISGSGFVDGYAPHMSSARGELHGVTALSIITDLLCQHYHFPGHLTVISDNQGVVRKCNSDIGHSLRKQRDPNFDLLLTHHHFKQKTKMTSEWVRSHADKSSWETVDDLILQRLSRDEIFNVWVDRMAEHAWQQNSTDIPDPPPNSIERWAIYSRYPFSHKVTNHFQSEIYTTLSYESTAKYLESRLSLTPSKLIHINSIALCRYMESLKIHKHATTIKLLHGWAPTYASLCRQGRSHTSICPRCNVHVETTAHVYSCPAESVILKRNAHLASFLATLKKHCTAIPILATLEYKLSLTLKLPYVRSYCVSIQSSPNQHQLLLQAIKHQNIIGWDNFLRGYTFIYWMESYMSFFASSTMTATPCFTWDVEIIRASIFLSTSLWADRNCFIHGNNKREAKDLLRMRTVERVKYLYKNPPRLDRRYADIKTIPLESRLQCSTTTLQRWIKRVEHCTFVTKFLRDNPAHHQLTIPQAFARAMRTESALKYPP